MNNTVPTVKIVSPSSPCGFVIINEADRKPEHEIWTGDSKPAGEPKSDAKPETNSVAGNVARPVFSLTGSKKTTPGANR